MRRNILRLSMMAMIDLVGCSNSTVKEITETVIETTTIEETEIIEESTKSQADEVMDAGLTEMATSETNESEESEVYETVEVIEETEANSVSGANSDLYSTHNWSFSSVLKTDEQKEFALKHVENTDIETCKNTLNKVLEKALSLSGSITVIGKNKTYVKFEPNGYEKVTEKDSYEKVTKESNGLWNGIRYLYKDGSEEISIESNAVSGLDLYLGFNDITFEIMGSKQLLKNNDYILCAYEYGDGSKGYMNILVDTNDNTLKLDKIEVIEDSTFIDGFNTDITYDINFSDSINYDVAISDFEKAVNEIKK